MNFGKAYSAMEMGAAVKRESWDSYVELQIPDANSKMTVPYIYMTSFNQRMPWLPSQADLAADDWDYAT